MSDIEELMDYLKNPINGARDQGVLIGAGLLLFVEVILGFSYCTYAHFYESALAEKAIAMGYANPKCIRVEAEDLADNNQAETLLRYKNQAYLLRTSNDSLQFSRFEGIETTLTRKLEKQNIIKYTPIN